MRECQLDANSSWSQADGHSHISPQLESRLRPQLGQVGAKLGSKLGSSWSWNWNMWNTLLFTIRSGSKPAEISCNSILPAHSAAITVLRPPIVRGCDYGHSHMDIGPHATMLCLLLPTCDYGHRFCTAHFITDKLFHNSAKTGIPQRKKNCCTVRWGPNWLHFCVYLLNGWQSVKRVNLAPGKVYSLTLTSSKNGI
jgi:hypothetical protein